MAPKRKPETKFTNIQVYIDDLQQLDALRSKIEAETGLSVTMGSLARRALREGLRSIQSRPVLGIEYVWRKGETE